MPLSTAPRRRWILLGGLGAATAAFLLVAALFIARRPAPALAPAAVVVGVPASAEDTVRILAGASVPKYIDQLGLER